jgi:hypothetical protein
MWGNQQGNSAPIVVQGVAVPSYGNKYGGSAPYGGQPSASYGANSQPMGNFNGYKGEQQPKQFQDVTFSILFFLHLAVMILLGIMYGPAMVSQNGGNYTGVGQIVFLVAFCGLVAMGISSVSLGG